MPKRDLPINCPSCGTQLIVTNMQCSNCETKIEGTYTIPSLIGLSSEEEFLMIEFVKCNGSPKRLSKILNLSYPAVRSRLDKLIMRLEDL